MNNHFCYHKQGERLKAEKSIGVTLSLVGLMGSGQVMRICQQMP